MCDEFTKPPLRIRPNAFSNRPNAFLEAHRICTPWWKFCDWRIGEYFDKDDEMKTGKEFDQLRELLEYDLDAYRGVWRDLDNKGSYVLCDIKDAITDVNNALVRAIAIIDQYKEKIYEQNTLGRVGEGCSKDGEYKFKIFKNIKGLYSFKLFLNSMLGPKILIDSKDIESDGYSTEEYALTAINGAVGGLIASKGDN